MRTQDIIHCFRCDRTMEVERDEDGYMDMMISDGLFFQANGNYGSTIFDAMPELPTEFLEIVICDDCVVSHKESIDHVKIKPQQTKRVVSCFEAVL